MDPLHVIKFLLLVVAGMATLYLIPTIWNMVRQRFGTADAPQEILENPPWREPVQVYSSQEEAYKQLHRRLTLVDDRSTPEYDGLRQYLRDMETGQLWLHYFYEPNMSQVYVLQPIDEIPPEPDQT